MSIDQFPEELSSKEGTEKGPEGIVDNYRIQKYLRYVKKTHEVDYNYVLPYSIGFLEIADTFAKYKVHVKDIEVNEIVTVFNSFDLKEDILNYIMQMKVVNGNQELVDEIIERYYNLEDNGEEEDLIKSVRLLADKFAKVLKDSKIKDDKLSHNFVKLAFATIRIGESSTFDANFSYIEKVLEYIKDYLGLNIKENTDVYKNLIELVSEGAPCVIKNKFHDADNICDVMIDEALSIHTKGEWARTYSEAIRFICSLFASNEEEGFRALQSKFVGLNNFILPKHPIYLYKDIDELIKENPALDFDNLGQQLLEIMIANIGCKDETEWNKFSITNSLLEIIGKFIQIQREYKATELYDANNELVEKFLRRNPIRDIYRFEFENESHLNTQVTLQSKLKLSDGTSVPVKVVFAKPKSIDSMKRKLVAKGTSITEINDTLRAQFFIGNSAVFDNPKLLEETIARIMHMISTRVGTDIQQFSFKNTFITGGSNSESLGQFRCFKYVTKVNTTKGIYPFEVMILENYPDDHDEYEKNKRKKIIKKYCFISYEAMIEELTQEMISKTNISFDEEDKRFIDIIENYVKVYFSTTNTRLIHNKLLKDIYSLFERLNKKHNGVISVQYLTLLRAASTMAG